MTAREDAVLLLVDFQVGPLWEGESADLRSDVAHLAEAARMLGVPSMLTARSCESWGPVIPELADASPGARLIERSVPNAWDDARVRGVLEAMKRSWLIIAGMTLESCVAETALEATRAGWTVYVPLDACGYECRRAAAIAVQEMADAGVVITCCPALMLDLARGRGDAAACNALALTLRHHLPATDMEYWSSVRCAAS